MRAGGVRRSGLDLDCPRQSRARAGRPQATSEVTFSAPGHLEAAVHRREGPSGHDPYASQRRWSESARDRSNKGRTYYVRKERIAVHSMGMVSVFVSTTKKPEAGRPLHEPKILLSNDLGLTAREAVLRYTLRWQIEKDQPDCTSNDRWAQPRFLAYHQGIGTARTGDLVPPTASLAPWRTRMSDHASVPPRARRGRV